MLDQTIAQLPNPPTPLHQQHDSQKTHKASYVDTLEPTDQATKTALTLDHAPDT